MHLDLENPDEQIQKLLDYLKPYLSKEDLSNRTLIDVQDELITYIKLQLEEESVADLYVQQLWLQVEDHDTREELHYLFVEKYVSEMVETNRNGAVDLLTAYILEKETLGEQVSSERARVLMASVVQ